MTRFLYDTAVFLYALGGEHPYRDPCRAILDRATRGELEGEASADLIQEIVHHRFRRTGDRRRAVRNARDIAELCELHPARPEDVLRGLDLYEEHERLSARDAVFAALALNRGLDAILSPDRGFDGLPALNRVDPVDDRAVAALTASDS